MRIIIDIPKEFEDDYKGDMFKDFFSRVLCDIQDGTLCGNYEKETAEMFLKAFNESKPMDRIVEELEKEQEGLETSIFARECGDWYGHYCNGIEEGIDKAIEILKAGGNNGEME